MSSNQVTNELTNGVANSLTFEQTFDLMAKTKSLYIPLLPKDITYNGKPLFTEEALKEFYGVYGEIARIDFVNKPTKVDQQSISVFIHFEKWEHNAETDYLIQQIVENSGEFTTRGYYNNYGYNPFISTFNNRFRFFKVKINHSPIPVVVEIPTNIHQLVNNNKRMEELIEQQKNKIEELETVIQQLTSLIHIDERIDIVTAE